MSTKNPISSTVPSDIRFAEAVRVFARIGLLSFGGPTAQIAVMHHILVEEKKWLDENLFVHALSFCMLLPGPEAMQLVTYAGWRLFGLRGGLMAGLLFVLPGAVVMLALSMIYALYGQIAWVDALFFGIKAAVLVIVIEALLRVAKRALQQVGAVVAFAVADGRRASFIQAWRVFLEACIGDVWRGLCGAGLHGPRCGAITRMA